MPVAATPTTTDVDGRAALGFHVNEPSAVPDGGGRLRYRFRVSVAERAAARLGATARERSSQILPSRETKKDPAKAGSFFVE